MNDQEILDAFQERLDLDQIRIGELWNDLRSGGWDGEKAALLIQDVHRLVGAAVAVGYSGIGNSARQFELTLKNTGADPDWIDLRRGYEDLKCAITARLIDDNYSLDTYHSVADSPSHDLKHTANKVFIVDDDSAQAELLAAQVRRFGYTVHTFTSFADFHHALHHEIPSAILMDIVFPEGELAGADEIHVLRQEFGDLLPVFFISVRDDAVARLQALRAGGKGYFTKPVDIDTLMDDINKLSVEITPQPFRVLIVDDSEIQAKTNALHLNRAKIETSIVLHAEGILEGLSNFRPDLILLDLYMPNYSGLELAQMLRQIKAYVGLPIVFLSAETDRDKQLIAVKQGGDDFLSKPIKPDHLISAVTARIERYRQIQTLMLRDGLTGLFNHTTMREHLIQEVSRAQRTNQPFSLAMIDIDFFKKVNDTFGHATGDKVLRSLAHALTLRLRRSDIIGRYGGEEFIIILPNTEKSIAQGLMDELRESFSQINHTSNGVEFRVTFSCGIAGFPEEGTPSSLSEAADQAMYTAKKQGRNQVKVYQRES